jgi:hypothetical protein
MYIRRQRILLLSSLRLQDCDYYYYLSFYLSIYLTIDEKRVDIRVHAVRAIPRA